MKIIKPSKNKNWKKEAIKILENGGLLIFPCETCYGVACEVTNQEAISKLLEYKSRPEGKAISIAVSGKKMAEDFVEITETADNLMDDFLPGPLTVICNSKHKADKRLEAENGTLGIRIPDYKILLELIEAFGKPITATSGNTAGQKSLYSLADFQKYTSNKKQKMIDGFIDMGILAKNPPSTVVDATLNELRVIREGEIKIENGISRISISEDETKKIAQNFYKRKVEKLLEDHCVIVGIQGELGAGKTRFVKGIAEELKIEEIVISPTFTISREYDYLNGKLIHIDTWRLSNQESLEDYLEEKEIKKGNLVMIEWAEKAKTFLEKMGKKEKVEIFLVKIEHVDLEKRSISF